MKKKRILLLAVVMVLTSGLSSVAAGFNAYANSTPRLLDWEEFFDLTNDLFYRTADLDAANLAASPDDDFVFSRLAVKTMYHEILLATNPTEYFFRYDGVNVLQFETPGDARVAYEKLSAIAGENVCCAPQGDECIIQWVHPDRPVFDPIAGYADLVDLVDLSDYVGIDPLSIPYTPTTRRYDGYLSWGAPRMGIPAYAQWLRDGNINTDKIIVAIYDHGIDFTHPQFVGRASVLDAQTPCWPLTAITSHGNAVGGVIADLTRDLPVYLVSLNVSHFSGEIGVANATDWATRNGVNVINHSHTFVRNRGIVCAALTRAINNNVVVVGSAGNAGIDLGTRQHYCLDGHLTGDAIFVASFRSNETPQHSSNWGRFVDFAGPGFEVQVPFSDFRQSQVFTRHGYVFRGETSIAAPHIAAAAALLLLNRPYLTPAEVKATLTGVADFSQNAAHFRTRYGAGIPDMSLLIGDTSSPRPDFGDVNGDGILNAEDITLLRRYLTATNRDAFLMENPNFNRANADVNGNGVIDYADVQLLRQYLAATDPATVTLGRR